MRQPVQLLIQELENPAAQSHTPELVSPAVQSHPQLPLSLLEEVLAADAVTVVN